MHVHRRTSDNLRTEFKFKTFIACYRTPGPPEGFWKGFGRVSERVSEGFVMGPRTCQPKDPSKPLQNAFKNPSKTLQEGIKIDDASGFLVLKLSSRVRGSCSRNESLEFK